MMRTRELHFLFDACEYKLEARCIVMRVVGAWSTWREKQWARLSAAHPLEDKGDVHRTGHFSDSDAGQSHLTVSCSSPLYISEDGSSYRSIGSSGPVCISKMIAREAENTSCSI